VRFPRNGPLPGLSAANTKYIKRQLEMTQQRLFPCSSSLLGCFERLLAEHRLRGPMAPLMARLTFHELLVSLVRDLAPAPPADPEHRISPPIQRVLAWINDHLTEPLSMTEVAEAGGLSPSSLRQHFRAEMGCSPGDYVTRRRIERAEQLLHDPQRSITEVAMALGFNTSAYFTAVFKRLTGSNPQEYRKRVLASDKSSTQDNQRSESRDKIRHRGET
jgi:AraC-like DNA-binding protein